MHHLSGGAPLGLPLVLLCTRLRSKGTQILPGLSDANSTAAEVTRVLPGGSVAGAKASTPPKLLDTPSLSAGAQIPQKQGGCSLLREVRFVL
eukprot:6318920-Amphidinium_carterae.1